MKTSINVGLAFAAVAAFAIVGSQARAEEEHPAAITLKDREHPVGCRAFGLTTPDKIHTVATPSGNTKLICHFTIPEAQRPSTVEEKKGFRCGIFLPSGNKFTTDTSFQRTPGGQAKLECTIKL